ncbi:MAG: radical SAM protein [Desulfovibrionaceae bacterium]|nr:radical SAM protein [Desulfovibrionaceae bacterium]
MLYDVSQLPGPARVCIYGTGGRAAELKQRIEASRPDLEIICFGDSFKKGGEFQGLPVVNAEGLDRDGFDYIVITSYFYDQIWATLEGLGLAERCFVFFDLAAGTRESAPAKGSALGPAESLEAFEAMRGHAPGQLNFTLTNACNSRCVFCAYKTYREKRQTMDLTTFARIAEAMAGSKVEVADFSPLIGETLLDPGFKDKVSCAREAGIKTLRLTTNAILLGRDPDLLALLVEAMETISVSIPGLAPEAYREVFGVDVYQDVLNGLLLAAEIKEARGRGAKINLCHRSYRPAEAIFHDPGFERLLPYLKQGVIFFDPGDGSVEFDNWSGAVSDQDLLGSMSLKAVRSRPDDPPCEFIVNGAVTVLPDGGFRLCPCRFRDLIHDDLVIAQPGDPAPMDAIFGPVHRQLVTDWVAGRRPRACVNCSLYRPCRREPDSPGK